MKTKITMILILAISAVGVCFAQSNPNNTNLPVGSNSVFIKDANKPNSAGVTTKMNGNSTTTSGVAISSASIGSEGRNTSGNSN